MSMILDAIKRSKEVDARGDVPSVDTEHFVASRQTRSWTISLTGITLGCLALLLIGGIFYTTSLFKSPNGAASAPLDAPGSVSAANLLPQGSDTKPLETVSREGTQQPPKAKRDVSLRPVVINIPEQLPETTQQDEAQLAKLYAAMNEASNAAAQGRSMTEDAMGDNSDEDVAASSVFIQAIEANQSSTVEELPVDFAEILAKAQSELGVSPLVESTEPLLETLSQQIKDDIPSLIYSAHDFRPSGRSRVILNGESAGERQKVGAFTVVEILPDSVILRWRETQFRVRARNSWINM
ncbi:general secretion pathway protein GspB [Luminiphilus sp.]|nr:general secretion pathway protein GspB [Luminiphilus sp.]